MIEYCEHCTHELPPRPVVVKEVVKEVEVGENAFWLRICKGAFCMSSIIVLSLTAGYNYSEYLDHQQIELMMKDPQVKIEVQELPGTKTIKKFTRP